jgi:hypothetical protein
MNFFHVGQAIWEENGVRKVHEGATSLGGAPWGVGHALGLVASSCSFQTVYYFPNFLYIPKRTKSTFMELFESVYLPYHIPTPFQDSGVFRKVSSMCSSGVIV